MGFRLIRLASFYFGSNICGPCFKGSQLGANGFQKKWPIPQSSLQTYAESERSRQQFINGIKFCRKIAKSRNTLSDGIFKFSFTLEAHSTLRTK